MKSKSEFRQYGLQKMRSLTRDFLIKNSQKIIRNLENVPEFQMAKNILSCLSYNHEVNTWPIVEKLVSDPLKKVYVPRANTNNKTLHVHPYPCQLQTLKIGLKQPREEEPELPIDHIDTTIDVALILGVLFDRNEGYRLGYGKGFFDRFLTNKSFCTIGLAFEHQLIEALPTEDHDIPLHVIVTEENIYRYKSK